MRVHGTIRRHSPEVSITSTGAATSRRRAAASLHQRELRHLVEGVHRSVLLAEGAHRKSALFVCPIIPRQNWRRS